MTFRRLIALISFLALGLPALAAGPDGLVPTNPSVGSDTVAFEELIGAQVPLDVPFRDEQEQTTTLREAMAGKPTILALVYYRCPQLCTLVLNDLLTALQKMPPDFTAGQKFNVICVSFDPKEHGDLGSAKKKHYLENYRREGADWRFLTGKKESIDALTSAVGFKFEFDRAFKEYNHPSGIIVLTPDGRTSRYFLGLGYDGEYRLDEKSAPTTLRMSLIEASDGQLGTILDRMYLKCYRFDHTTKKYSPWVMGILRVAGVITVVAIATAALTFLALDRRKRARAELAAKMAQLEATKTVLAAAKTVDGESGGTT